MAGKLTTSCVITHFNYGRYIGECVEGALAQTTPFDEIVLVDDGSNDGSLDNVRRVAGQDPRIQLIEKPNGGQLSAFNAGYRASTGQVVFFLDADDVFEPAYTQEVLRVYEREPTQDFVFCGHTRFDRDQGVRLFAPEDRDIGYSAIYTLTTRRWIGGPTSCLSMRRSVLGKILPLPFEDEWRTRADDCVIFGASIVGARKYFLAKPLVRYRVHGQNKYYGTRHDPHEVYRRRLALNRLFAYFVDRMGYNREHLSELVHREFRTAEKPDRRRLGGCIRAAMYSKMPYGRRFVVALDMLKYYLIDSRSRRGRQAAPYPLTTATPAASTAHPAPPGGRTGTR